VRVRGQIFLFSSASVALAPIMQTGPPVTVGRPTAVSVTTTSISLEWPATTECVSAAPFASLPCNASLYKLQAKKTHYSSDFPVESPAWGRIIYSTSSAVVFGGLDDMSTYAVRIAARRTFDAAFGAWSESEFAKLTGGAPTLQAALLPIGESLYNDRVLLRWQSDVNPKQADRFYVSFGLDLDSMRDFRDEDGARRVLMDADVCTVVPAENLQRCEVFVTGLELRTIFLFKVYSGNINGFETRGSAPRIAATLAMPVAPATNVTLGNISLSGNASDFGVELTWLRPVGFPAVNRFYVAASVSGGPFRRVTDVIRATGSGREVSAFVGALLKGRVYRLRVHSGNSEGPSGFHVDPEADPTRSEEVELVPDGVPGRVLVTAAAPSVPDMNSMMAVTWDPPNAGAAATHYTLAYRACGAAPAAVCRDGSTPALSPPDEPVPYVGCVRARRTCDVPCAGAENEGVPGEVCRFAALGPRSSMSAVVLGLAANTSYQLLVYAGSPAGFGLVSRAFPEDPAANAPPRTKALPPAIESVEVAAVAADAVTLRLNNSDSEAACGGACVYRVTWESPDDPALAGEARGVQGATYRHGVNFTERSVAFVFRVFAGDPGTGQYEEYGASVSLPGPCTDFKIVAATENSLTFSWTAPRFADTYQIFMSATLASFRTASPATAETHNVKVEGLATGLPYKFRVRGKVAGKTPFDFPGSEIITGVPAGLPPAPHSLRVEATTHTSATLRWNASVADAVRYQVVREVTSGALRGFRYPQDVEVLRGGATSATVTGIEPGSVNAFKVFAGNFKGFETGGSNVVAGVAPVGAPRLLSVRGVSAESATLDWLPPLQGASPAGYQVAYTIGEVETRLADVQHLGGALSTQSVLVTPLQRAPHSFRVYAKAPPGYYEPRGAPAAVGLPLLVPFGLRIAAVTSSSVTLKWDVPPGIGEGDEGAGGAYASASFRVEYTDALTGVTRAVAGIPTSADTYTVRPLPPTPRASRARPDRLRS